MRTDSEMERVAQYNETWLNAQRSRQNVPILLGVFNMSVFKKYVVVKDRRAIRLYLDQACLFEKGEAIKQKMASEGAFSIGIMEDETKISYYTVVSVRDLSSEEQELPLFLLRVKCRTLEEVGHICHLHRMTHSQRPIRLSI